MLEPVKIAFGQFMGRFYASIVPTTQQMKEYVSRELQYAIMYAPARMIDQAQEMFLKYLRLDADDETTTPHELPIILVAFARDYTPTMRDYTHQATDFQYVTIPGDEKGRMFGLKSLAGDLRVQVAVFAREQPTAQSIAAQFCLFLDAYENRRFKAEYQFAGLPVYYPVQVETPEAPAISVQTDAKNLVILAIDLTLKCTVPIFYAPREGEENDGQGTVGTIDPPGYVRLENMTINDYCGEPDESVLVRSYDLPDDDDEDEDDSDDDDSDSDADDSDDEDDSE